MASTTLAQFKTAVVAAIGLDATADDVILGRWINEGYEQFVADTHCYVDWATMTLTSGTHTYDLPAQAMAILELYNSANSTQYDMERCALPELIDLRRADSSGPARHYATVGANLLSVYPTPGAGETLTVYYVVRPTAMSSASDTPTGVPAEFHQGVEYYALARAAEYDNHGPSQFGTLYRAYYEREVRRCKAAIQGMGGNRAAPVVAGMRRQTVSSDRSRIYNSL